MGALDGMLVIGIEQAVAAPLCTLRLAQAGARVIKVEHPDGDFARGYDAAVLGQSSYFIWLNAGKESIALDLKAPSDRALLARMIARADVVVQNFGTDAAQRLGIDAATLNAKHPSLVALDITGYRPVGAYAQYKGYDLLVQAETGLAAITGLPEGPGRVGISIADIGAGTTAYALVLEGLLRRGRTGKGAALSVSLFDTLAEWMTVPYLHERYAGQGPQRVGLAHPSIAPYGSFRTKDGAALVLAIQSEREWAVFCDSILQRPDLVRDPRTETNIRRVANRTFVDTIVSSAIQERNAEDLMGELLRHRIAFGRVAELRDAIENPLVLWKTIGTGNGDAQVPFHAALDREAGLMPDVPTLNAHERAIRAEFGDVTEAG